MNRTNPVRLLGCQINVGDLMWFDLMEKWERVDRLRTMVPEVVRSAHWESGCGCTLWDHQPYWVVRNPDGEYYGDGRVCVDRPLMVDLAAALEDRDE